MFRLHFAYMSPYQVLEYHMEFLETFGCIWSSKEVRCALPLGATTLERRPEVARSFDETELKTEAGATSRSDTLRSLPKPRATCWSDLPRSLRVAYMLEFMFSQGPFCHFIMHAFYSENLCFNTLKNHQKPLESHLFESIDQFIIENSVFLSIFPEFLYMINLKSNMGLRGIMEIINEHSSRHRVCLGLCPSLSSKLDHPRSNPYIHEFSFPIVKKEELCFINNNGSWYKKEPNFQYNNYQQKSYSNNQQSGYQPRNNQQGSYQPQQNPPPGFNNKGNHSSQQQSNPSTSTPQRHLKVAPAGSEVSRATLHGRSRFRRRIKKKSPQSEVSERGRRVAPAGSDIMGATPRSRSRFRRNGAQKLTRSDVLERHLKVAPAQSEVSRATLQGRSRFCRNTTRGNDSGATSPSDTLTSLPNRSSLFLTTHSPFPFIQSKVKMVKKTKGKLEAEKKEAERTEFALRGKALSCEPTGSGTQRTVRQQTLAARKSQEQEKRAGKSVAVPTYEESETESADEQAPTKKAKMSKGKGVAVDRDRAKTPSVEELYDHLKNGVTWTPTRFADLDLLKELGLESDIEAMLGHLKMPKLLTMAYPFYKDVTCQFLSSLVVTYHDTAHVRQGWGKITFKVNGREYNMNFKDIGRVMGFQDIEDHSLPKCENLPTELWKLITGNRHSTGADKNSHIRHPSVRYLHRLLVHAFYPRKQAGNVTEEDMRLLCPAIRPYAQPGVLPLPSTDIYATFGMVSFFVGRLEHYRDWAWYTTDSRPKMGIGGMITPLLQFLNVPLGQDAAGPRFIDGTYLRIATYFSGMYGKDYVYHYYLQGKPVEVVLPNRNLTSLEIPGAVSFNIPQEYFLGEHGPLDPIQAASSRRRSVPTQPDPPVADTSEHIYGPPRYYFKPHDGVLPPGALRDAHDHIGRLQRWNKAQDRTIAKLKDKCKALSKTVKKQAKTSAKFMKKVADVLTRGGIAGCSSADFAFANTSNPQPPPPPDALGFPLTAAQLQRKWRNPPTQPSTSGNKSPSLASSDSEHEIDEVESQPWLHFAYMSPYQVLEYHMELLETFGCIWSSKEVRCALPLGATTLERRPEVARSFDETELKTEAGATSRSDTLRSLPKPRATCWSDLPRSLRVAYMLEFMFSQGPFCHFIMHAFYSENLCFNTLKNHQKPLESHLFESIDQFIIENSVFLSIFPEFLYMINLKSNMGLRGIMEIINEHSSRHRVCLGLCPSLRLSDYLHSRCFDISQNWFDNHLYYSICLRSLENS
ncbi:hypothetical protein IGI04_012961 [Brassica rapa subsp. trilocularis]|uniref:Arabidopsis retrotransposon Orf1 C-terminal domain-containing protein n=1 Tax=Brassica rapa subsp. trilocularis TaxID=1813537 RepID=A0ABQ7N7G7_BRACM|nr:hypothetical protein IGI04_012961 [Brassica rapa subsp. trilocularis]